MRIMLLGEGERDVGRMDPGVRRGRPCDFEGTCRGWYAGSRRWSWSGPTSGTTPRRCEGSPRASPIAGRPMRKGGKSKELRNAVLAALQTHEVVIALIDARADELAALQRDTQEILAQCRERSAEARVAIGLAVHEIEIWLLADPDARKAAFGPAVGEQPLPEDLEGVGDPKSLWRALSGQAPPPEGVDGALHADEQRRAGWATLRPERGRPRMPAGFQALCA